MVDSRDPGVPPVDRGRRTQKRSVKPSASVLLTVFDGIPVGAIAKTDRKTGSTRQLPFY